MAYPTATQYTVKPIENVAGLQPIQNTSTVQAHPLGMRAKGQDFGTLAYGISEFIYLKGVASTAAGDFVVYDEVAGTTTRTVAASRGPIAVAMSANVANQFGWYCVFGNVPANTTAAGTGAANAGLAVTATAGQATVRGAASQGIDGLITKTTQDTPSAGFTQTELHFPCANGLT